MEIIGEYTTGYFAYYFLKPNEYGLTHILWDVQKDRWSIVHASGRSFPAKLGDYGVVSGNIYFCV